MSEDITPYGKKKHGGARRTVDPIRGKSKRRPGPMLYDDEYNAISAQYGSITKAVRHALSLIPGWEEPAKKAIKK